VNVTQVIGAAFLLAGAGLSFLAGVGVLRFPDVFARMHAATKPATLGLVLLAIGAAFAVGSIAEWLTMTLIVFLQFLTAPAGAHLVARVAARSGVAADQLVRDDLPGS
jgi:multicomponent Na+:H+ antiporter subunit G